MRDHLSFLVRQKVPRLADVVRTGKAAAMEELAELRPGCPAGRAYLARRYGLIPRRAGGRAGG
jgi:hypothetical protein